MMLPDRWKETERHVNGRLGQRLAWLACLPEVRSHVKKSLVYVVTRKGVHIQVLRISLTLGLDS